MEKKKNQKSDKTADDKKTGVTANSKTASEKNITGELNSPLWSVVSFENCMASSLTYSEAEKKIKQLKAKKISGLCIITDEAANRLS